MFKILIPIVVLGAVLWSAPIPTVSGDQPGSQLAGEAFSQELCIENTGTTTGYSPQFELITPPGILLQQAEFQTLNTLVHTETCLAAECNVTNPVTSQVRKIDNNETFYVLQFPIGSFPSTLPKQCIDVTYQLDQIGQDVQLGTLLDISVEPLFALGETAVNDGNYTYGSSSLFHVDPNVMRLKKYNNAREGKRATGPSYPIIATLEVDIAKDETVDALTVTDTLDPGMHFVSVQDDAGCTATTPTSSPGGTLIFDCGNVTGIVGIDKKITYKYYIDENDTNGDPILGTNGKPAILTNHAEVDATYGGTALPSAIADSNVTAMSMTLFKSSDINDTTPPDGLTPGDMVIYRIEIQTSDYFLHNDLNISDLLGDGQSIDYNSSSLPAEYIYDGTTYAIDGQYIKHCDAKDPATGTCWVDFNLSGQMQSDGLGDTLDSGKTVTLTFFTTVDGNYTVINNAEPVAMGDLIENKATVYPSIPNVGAGVPDESSVTNTIEDENFTKSLYAINGTVVTAPPYDVHPGDTVTYRIRSEMPVRSFYDYNLSDFLPSPFFQATEVTGFDNSSIPPAGSWGLGPDNNYNNPPILTVNASENKLIWTYGSDNENNQNAILDLLFTVTATTEPMADNLDLVNIAVSEYKNAAGVAKGSSGFISLITKEPSLDFNKTIISSSNSNAAFVPPPTGYDSAMENVDAGDRITYKIHLENIGHGSAYDINLTDRVSQGGIAGEGLESCGNLQIDTNSTNTNSSGDLFYGIYTIDHLDPLSYYDITYTCIVRQDASPGEEIDNNVTLTSYANTAGGPNFVNKLLAHQSKLIPAQNVYMTKSIVATSISDTSGSSINQGEIVTFDINVSLGEGNYTNFSLMDNTCSTLTLQSQSFNVELSGSTVSVTGTEGSVDGNLSYRCEQQMVNSGTNTVTLTADHNITETAQSSWTVVAPAVVTSKRMNPSRADAGDTVTVTMRWTNDTTHPAYKCKVFDPLNTSVFDLSTFTMTSTPADYTCDLNSSVNRVECIYIGDLTKPCSDGPARFTVNVRSDVNTSGRLTNEISFVGETLPAGHVGENNTTLNGSVESNATAKLRLQQPTKPVKVFTATSEPFTDPGDTNLNNTPEIAIGELIDVEITYGFYQGTTLNVLLDDILRDSGRFTYVPGTMTIARSASGITVEDSDINTSLTQAALGTFVTVDDAKLKLRSTRIRLPLGNVYNSDVNGSTTFETLVLRFRIKVQNKSAVQAGEKVRDRGIVRFDDSLTGAQRSSYGNTVSALVVEPLPSVTKDVNQTTVQSGSSLAYTVRVCNDENNDSNNPFHTTSGFDWNVTDRIPDEIALVGPPQVRTGSTGATVSISTGGQEVQATIDRLDRGECIYIDYNATVRNIAHYGQILTNTAQYQTTSLPGKYGSAGVLSDPDNRLRQEPGERDGERTGDGSSSDLNDLHSEVSRSVTVEEAAITKTLESGKTFYAIGEKVHYRILIGLPKGEANAVLLEDTLPVGLELNVSEVAVQVGPNLTVANNPPLISQNGQIVTFDFGDINASDISTIAIDYNVTVSNILSNQDTTPLVNDANVSYDDPNNIGARITQKPQQPAATVTVGEPNLFIQKWLTNGALNAQAGSTVSWKVEISNNGHLTAYAVDWNDTLPSHLANISHAVLSTNGASAVLTGTTTALDTTYLVENNQTLSLPKFDLPAGTTITITFESTVTDDAVAGETQTNRTQAVYRSLLEGTDGARDGSQCGDDDDDTVLNNYCESAKEDLTIDAKITIDKHLQGKDDHFTIGEMVTYDMRISVIQGHTTNVVLNDTLPVGLQYVSHTHQAFTAAMQYDIALADINSGSGQQVVIEFGDVNNSDDGNLSNDYIDIELEARVVNILSNQNDTNLTNGDAATSPVTVISDSNSSSVGVPVEIKVTEPSLVVTKQVNPATQALGDVVTYRIEIGHDADSTNDAYDVNVTDVLPVGLQFIPGSLTGATVIQNGQTLSFNFVHIGQGTSKVVSYQARIDTNVTVGTDLNNSLDTLFSSIADANGTLMGGRNGQDGIGPDATVLNNYARHVEAKVVPNDVKFDTSKSISFMEDTNRDGLINAGDKLEYKLSVVNNLSYDAGDVNVTDTIDQSLTLLLNTIRVNHNNTEIFNASSTTALDWNTTTDYWYRYANSEFEINYNSDTNDFELYWNNVLGDGETLDVIFDTKINDGNVTTVVFGDASVLDINRTQNSYVSAGIVIANTFTVDSNRTVSVLSNEANVTTDQRGIAGKPSKMFISTDQHATDPGDTLLSNTPPVAVGEIIDVEMVFDFSGGTIKNVLLRDNYDPANFVRTGDAYLERNCSDMWVGDFNSTFGTVTDTISVEGNLTDTANGFELKIGDIFNPHYNGENMTCRLTLTFHLRVDNNISVQKSSVLEDNASVRFDRYVSVSEPNRSDELFSSLVGVRVTEPNVKVQKTVNISTAKVGDIRKYTIQICDENTTDVSSGFEWNVIDHIPDELLPDGTVSFDANGTSATYTGGITGQELNVTIDVLHPAECVSLYFGVTVTSLAEFEQQIRNDVNLTTTSLEGSSPFERTGSGGINDLNTTDYDILSIDAPIIKKDIIGKDKYYAIGDVVQHRITLSFPATTGQLHILDLLPDGLDYVPHSVRLTVPSDVNVSHNPPLETIDTANHRIDFDIGDLNVSKAGDLYLDINTTVRDIVDNYNGVALKNEANMTFIDPTSGISGELNISAKRAISVGEPDLSVNKALTNYNPNNPQNVGDLLHYRIVIDNNGTTWAYHVKWSDQIPVPYTGQIQNAILDMPYGDLYETNTTTPLRNASFVVSPDENISLPPFDIPDGRRLVIEFDTEILSLTTQTITNQTQASTQSTVGGGGRKQSVPGGGIYTDESHVSFILNQLPEAHDNGCYKVTSYTDHIWNIGVNDKLGDGTKAEHTWRVVTSPANGTVNLSKDGIATYKPAANFKGMDYFVYELEDLNGDKSQARVCIEVECASSQTSDGGDAHTLWSLLLLFLFSSMIAAYFIRVEGRR
jgi:uncharacterized repeat protein (TIGR01451 family)/fimbrial isopeptide formation D2 family protein